MFWLSDFDKGCIFFYCQSSSSLQICTCNCAFTVFTWIFDFFFYGRLCFTLHCSFMVSLLSDFRKSGSAFVLTFQLSFSLKELNLTVHSFSLFNSARCSINVWWGPALHELCSSIASDVCTQETCWRKVNIFSWIDKKNCPCLCLCVSKLFCCKEELYRCMYGKLLRTLYISGLLICGFIPVCVLLPILKHRALSCDKYSVQGLWLMVLATVRQFKKKADHLLPLPNGG